MSAEERRWSTWVWVTWVTGLLSGDKHCQYAAWHKSNFQYVKRPEDPESASSLAKWKGEHADMLMQRRDVLEADGWTTYLEDQNKFKIKGQAATLSGGPDIVAVKDVAVPVRGMALADEFALTAPAAAGDGVVRLARVEDCKTGRRRDSDWWQVAIYMMFLPQSHDAVGDRPLAGVLAYRDGLQEIQPSAVDASVRQRIGATVRAMGSATPPRTTPSAAECALCDVAACRDRVVSQAREIQTEAF